MDQLGIDAELLSGGGTRQERKHQGQVIQGGQDAFHAHQCDMQWRHGCDHAAIAFVRDDTKRAGFGYAEVHTADAHICGQEDLAQDFAGRVRQYGNLLVSGMPSFS